MAGIPAAANPSPRSTLATRTAPTATNAFRVPALDPLGGLSEGISRCHRNTSHAPYRNASEALASNAVLTVGATASGNESAAHNAVAARAANRRRARRLRRDPTDTRIENTVYAASASP